MRSARRSIDVEVPVSKLLAVICDFERYPEFVSAVAGARVEEARDDQWRVAFEVVLLRRRVGYRLDLRREGDTRVTWTLVDGEWMTANEGSWELVPLGAHRTRAVYSLGVELAAAVPNTFVALLIDASLPRMLREFKRRAESLSLS